MCNREFVKKTTDDRKVLNHDHDTHLSFVSSIIIIISFILENTHSKKTLVESFLFFY